MVSYSILQLPLPSIHSLSYLYALIIFMADGQAPNNCPGTSDGVIQGKVWGAVVLLVALSMIGHCWYKTRKQLNEMRKTRIWQQHLRREVILRAQDGDGSRSPPPPPYQGGDWYEMDELDAHLRQAYDVERQRPIAPERAILREVRRDIFEQ